MADFWSGSIWRNLKYGDRIPLGELAPHATHHLRITPEMTAEPQLVYTNGHFSMGGTEVESLRYFGQSVELRIHWPWDYPVTMVLRAPQGKAWSNGQQGPAQWLAEGEYLRILLKDRFAGRLRLELI
ncbi:hypothetical protein RAC89_24155 [Paenibacillus sp. GD4]|uniref:hypothetical protein n=1 Tax=Paenibacillus sp. GD4 TaxID=3068890 RepID=UPI0027964309|nr:hypothetical protein [Paenibacillus sp. GD4]MDQ1913495.1 hypothetical protein [Paenibacillus sp. GD4]